MGTLSEARAELRDALIGAGIRAFSTIPENIVPPFAFASPAEPYLTPEGATYGGGLMARHQITLVASPGVNEVTADELDDMVEKAVLALRDVVDFFEVDRPGQITISGQPYLATSIATLTETRLQEDA